MNSGREHIFKGIGWYLYNGDFIEKNHNKIIFVGTCENITDDMTRLSNLLNIKLHNKKHIRKNTNNNDKFLSPKAIENILNFYKHTDYKALQKLVEYKFITKDLFSKTNSLNVFKQTILNSKTKYEKIFVMLGEVDCGYLAWVRAEKHGISVDDQIRMCIHNIKKFIEEVIIRNGKYKSNDVVLLGAILPTIKDNLNKNILCGARSMVTSSQYERTLKTMEYNNLLQELCFKKGYNYIDITSDIIGANNLVNRKFLSDDKSDHHLSNERSYNLWLAKMQQLHVK